MPQTKKTKSRRHSRKSHRKSCPTGQILRKGYIRRSKKSKSGRRVSSVCVKDTGKPGKGPKTLPPLKASEKGLLSKFGYHLHDSDVKRHQSLKKAISAHNKNKIIWHITYIENITAVPKNKSILEKDKKYVQSL